MKKLKDKQKLLAVFGILVLVLIAVGITYAFFSYSKDGSTENTIKSGSLTFWYDEINQSGNSIGIVDALPISDADGKLQTNAFNFKIQSTTSATTTIPYEITLRQKAGTDNIGNIVKVYLAKVASLNAAVNTEQEEELSLFSELSNVTKNGYSEKLLHTDLVPASDQPYTQYYRLKMWIDGNADYSADSNGNYPYNNKTFTVMVNVYANGHALDANSSTATINSVSIGGNQLTAVSTDYYEATLPVGTTSTTINVETGDYDKVAITKTDSTYTNAISMKEGIQRLSNTVAKTVNLTAGDNYFKIVATSEDGNDSKEIHLKIYMGLSVGTMYQFDPGDNITRNFYILSVDNTNNTVDLILDRNITQGTSKTTMNYNDAMAYFTTGDGLTIKNSWTKALNVDLPSAQAIADAGGINGWNYNTATTSNWSYFGVNSTSNTSKRVNYNWLYNYTRECTNYGCDTTTSLSSPEAYGYWTKDLIQNDSSNAWVVNWSGRLGHNGVVYDLYQGVRPVVTINQSELN